MRCHICDSLLTEPSFNKDFDTWEPCFECLEVINDTTAGYRDRPTVDEDEFGGDESLEAFPFGRMEEDLEPEFL